MRCLMHRPPSLCPASQGNHDNRPNSMLVYAPSRTVTVYAPAEFADKASDPCHWQQVAFLACMCCKEYTQPWLLWGFCSHRSHPTAYLPTYLGTCAMQDADTKAWGVPGLGVKGLGPYYAR
jgi:hypothetical protein